MSRPTEGVGYRAPACRRFAAPGCAIALVVVALSSAAAPYPGVGRAATPAEIAAWDIDVRPDFKGLPPGSGSVQQGQGVWEAKCASCHGTFGESNEVFPPLIGGTTAEDIGTGKAKSLTVGDQGRTTLMKLSTISTLWDYIRRAMPWNAPKTLSVDEVYAVVAYLLNLGEIVPADFVLSERNIAQVQGKLPNRNGMTLAHGLRELRGRPDVRNVACMRDCPTEARIASALPEHAKGSHGDLAQQNRAVGPTRSASMAADGVGTANPAAAKPTEMPVAVLARRKACMSCHGVDKAIVGPAFKDVAARYKGQSEIESQLVEKVKRGSSGSWGPVAMPPNPDLATADASKLVRWVLSSGL